MPSFLSGLNNYAGPMRLHRGRDYVPEPEPYPYLQSQAFDRVQDDYGGDLGASSFYQREGVLPDMFRSAERYIRERNLSDPAFRFATQGLENYMTKTATGRQPSYVENVQAGLDLLVPGVDDALVKGLGGVTPYIAPTLFHASPYKFAPTPRNPLGEFDPSRRLSGEGANVWGAGTYLAENPEVAESYFETFNRQAGMGMAFDGEPIEEAWETAAKMDADPVELDALKAVADIGSQPHAIADRYRTDAADVRAGIEQGRFDNYPNGRENAEASAANMEEIADWLMDNYKRFKPYGKASYYTVDLPDEAAERMIDFNKPFGEQPENVKKAFRDAGFPERGSDVGRIADELLMIMDNDYGLYQKRDTVQRFINKYVQNPDDPRVRRQLNYYFREYGFSDDYATYLDELEAENTLDTGENMYRWLSEQRGGDLQASEYLGEAGVPGSRFYDAGSRGAAMGSDTRNYVVFPGQERYLNITERR